MDGLGPRLAPRRPPGQVVADVRRGLAGGGTVLLHDSDRTSAPGSWRTTVRALPLFAEETVRRGLTVGMLAEHGLAGRRSVPC